MMFRFLRCVISEQLTWFNQDIIRIETWGRILSKSFLHYFHFCIKRLSVWNTTYSSYLKWPLNTGSTVIWTTLSSSLYMFCLFVICLPHMMNHNININYLIRSFLWQTDTGVIFINLLRKIWNLSKNFKCIFLIYY